MPGKRQRHSRPDLRERVGVVGERHDGRIILTVDAREHFGNIGRSLPPVTETDDPKLRDTNRLVVEYTNAGVLECATHARTIEPPVVVSQNGKHAERCVELGQDGRNSLRGTNCPPRTPSMT